MRPEFERQAEHLVAKVAAQGDFDGVSELARAYPLRVFPDAVGIGRDGREHLLSLAEAGARVLRTEIAAAKGIPAELADLLTGSTKGELEAQADIPRRVRWAGDGRRTLA